jgi:hypothetical protein
LFVEKYISILEEGGYMTMVHPSGWRNVDGVFKKTQELMLKRKIIYLEIHNENDGLKIFGAETRYDFYTLHNVSNNDYITKIKGQDGIIEYINLSKQEFIPNNNIKKIYSLVSKDNNTVNIIADSSYHTQRPHLNKEKNDIFCFPCVYTVKSGDNITKWYSNINTNGHFNIPKLIWSNFRISSAGSIVDYNGQYGLTQFSYAIVDNVDNLFDIKKAFDTKEFRNLMESCSVSDMSINRKIIATFRKDFWKEFID